jgi:hypothetical protein
MGGESFDQAGIIVLAMRAFFHGTRRHPIRLASMTSTRKHSPIRAVVVDWGHSMTKNTNTLALRMDSPKITG